MEAVIGLGIFFSLPTGILLVGLFALGLITPTWEKNAKREKEEYLARCRRRITWD